MAFQDGLGVTRLDDAHQSFRLLVLPSSHFCERARWGLDHAGVDYDEVRLAAGIHMPLTRRVASGTSLPVLIVPGGRAVQGSGRILDHLRLPGGEPALEDRFEHRIATLLRQYLYSVALHHRGSGVPDMLLDGVPAWQRLIGRASWPVLRRAMASSMNARPALTAALEEELERELGWFDDRVDGTRPLVGGTFGRADITAASLLAPLALPAEMPVYRHLRLPAATAATLARWRDRPSLRWVLSTYATYRRPNGFPPA